MSWGVATRNGVSIGLGNVVALSVNLGGGPAPAPVYFLSVTTSTDTEPRSIVVDSSGNSYLFGYNATGNNGLAAKLTSSGAKSLFKGFYTNNIAYTIGSIDSAGNIYVTTQTNSGCGYKINTITKLDSSFNVIASAYVDYNTGYQEIPTNAVADSSGNVWFAAYESNSYIQYLVKLNSALSSGSKYNTYGTGFTTTNSYAVIAYAPSGNLINGGAYYDYTICGCTGVPTPTVQSVTTSGVLNWTQKITSLYNTSFVKALAVDSSNNVYFTVNLNNLLIKLNSSGAVQWTNNAKLYADILYFLSIAVDSSGNVYCIGISSVYAGTLEIIKVNSAGVIQFSNKLSVTSGGTLNVSNSTITVNNGTMYIATTTVPTLGGGGRPTVLKVPTDGTLTQTIVVGSITYSYATSGVTSADYAITGSLTTNYPLGSATSANQAAYTPSIFDVTATTAVTPL